VVWAPGTERIYRKEGHRRTANVIGRSRRPSPRLTLLVMAHHDSKSQSLTFPWRMGLTLLALVAGLGLALLLVTGLLREEGLGALAWLASLAGGLTGVALLALSTMRSGNRSPGGVDNAGSLAIILELARILPGRLPEDVELIVLATGAEEDHMVGAMRWLDACLEETGGRPLYALNFDGAGAPGRTVLIERYGLGSAFAPTLSRAARRAASLLGIPVRGILMPPAMGIDAIPFAHRGVQCLTLASGSLGKAIMAVHSARDLPENLDRDALDRVARLALALLQDLAREARG
jgi:hypothetical protein